jgi:hypothetical protein
MCCQAAAVRYHAGIGGVVEAVPTHSILVANRAASSSTHNKSIFTEGPLLRTLAGY